MVADNRDGLRTAFTVSVDATVDITTGISAADRAATTAVLWRPGSTAADLVRPGHMLPLVAHPGGVAARPRHTEAAVDLAILTGLEPAGSSARSPTATA